MKSTGGLAAELPSEISLMLMVSPDCMVITRLLSAGCLVEGLT